MPEQKPIDPPPSAGGIKLTLEVGQPWRVVAWALFIFVMGMIAGASVLHLWDRGPPPQPVKSPLPRDYSHRMQHDLNLSDEQAQQIEAIFAKYEPLFSQTSHDARAQLREELEKMNQEILPVLNDRQREIHRQQWQRMLHRPHHKDRPPTPFRDKSPKPFKDHSHKPPKDRPPRWD